jgi:ABC-type uncharacterized transport system substrate-binding protein
MNGSPIDRRGVITLLGGTGAAVLPLASWLRAARAQQPALPIVGLTFSAAPDANVRNLAAFRKGLSEVGYIERQNVVLEFHDVGGRLERLQAVLADLVRRQVTVIATPGQTQASVAAKAATSNIPIVFGVSDDPVKLGLVTSLARPGGNATGANFFLTEVTAKRLGLFHELVPKAERVAVLVNPASTAVAQVMLQEINVVARALRLQIDVLNASTGDEIDAAFASLAGRRAGALFVQNDGFFFGRRVQIATLAARDRIPVSYSNREFADVGGLMSYGTPVPDMYRQVGLYTGDILKGAKPAELPVVQSTKFEFVLNLQTAKALGLTIPPGILAIADEVIE